MDRRLVELAQGGDRDAFAGLVHAVGDRLYALAFRILRDPHLAQDAYQEALLIAWRQLPNLRDPDKFDAWTRQILVKACYADRAAEPPALGRLRADHDPAIPAPCPLISGDRAAPAGERAARLASMPTLHAPRRIAPSRIAAARRARQRADVPAIVVLGDLVIDVVLAPDRPLERGTDVPGIVRLRQGGSATTTARWLGRLGARSSLVCAIGRDSIGRALVAAVTSDGVLVRAVRVTGAPTGRIGVLVEPGGERSFVQDRGAALRLRPEDLKPEWFAGADGVHLPAYSLLDQPLGLAGMAATRLAHEAGALVTVDVSSTAPLLAKGRRAALRLIEEAAPDLLFATKDEARALLGGKDEALLELAPVAVIKHGRKGATVLARDGKRPLRFEVATTPIRAADTTGAGDAFSAGFLHGWLDARRKGLPAAAALQHGAVAGNRAALRHLSRPLAELPLG